jgi:hypothetical protein
METNTENTTMSNDQSTSLELTIDQREQQIKERERVLGEREQNTKAQIDTYNQQMHERMEKLKKYENFESRLKNDALGTLEELGYSYDKLTEKALGQKIEPTPEERFKQLESTISELQNEKKQELEKRQQQEKQERLESGIKHYKNQLMNEVDENLNKYPVYKTMNPDEANDLAYEVAENYFKEHDRIPEKQLVLEYVENYLTEYYTSLIDNMKKVSKFKDMFSQNPESSNEPTEINNDLLPPFAQKPVDNGQQNSGHTSTSSGNIGVTAGGSFERLREQKLFEIKQKLR